MIWYTGLSRGDTERDGSNTDSKADSSSDRRITVTGLEEHGSYDGCKQI